MSEPLFSVVIPTRDQKGRLAATLDSIAATETDLGRVEVVVVDDGSTDGTFESLRGRCYPFAFQVHRVDFSSQSATTNEAIRRARGRYVLSSAQDILFDRKLFAEHLRWHERFGDEEIVVLGHLPYAPQLDVTPFMFYLVSGGFQFAYYLIRDPWNVPPNFLYAPNFSVRRDVLQRVGEFDEQFPFGCQDTDLGIRLARSGVRMVYNPEAIGYHNHPVDLEGYCRRQVTVGRAMVHLERKHPDFEGGIALQDRVLVDYAMRSEASLDDAWEEVRCAEGWLEDNGRSYQELWTRAYCQQQALEGLTDGEQRTLVVTEKLFKAYQKILGFHWGEGYMAEAIRADGVDAVERWVRTRLLKGQASIQTRRVAERRLRGLGIRMTLQTPRDCRRSLVTYGFASYAAAARYLERFQDPPAARCNDQVLLVFGEGILSRDEAAKLAHLAELVICPEAERGIVEALDLCHAEVVMVGHVASGLPARTAETVAERLFERVPDLAVLGGVVHEPGGRRRCGYAANGEARFDSASMGSGGTVAPVDVSIPEMCWVRRSTIDLLRQRRSGSGEPSIPWNRRICDAARGAGRTVAYFPEAVAESARTLV